MADKVVRAPDGSGSRASHEAGSRLHPAGVDPSRWRMRETAHINGGKEWFGYRHTCIEQPRLSRLTKYIRKDRSTQVTWRVDGRDMPSFEAAVEALSAPPVFTEDELAALRSLCGDWEDVLAKMPHEILYALTNKGAVHMADGIGKPTDVASTALSEAGLTFEGPRFREDDMTDGQYIAMMKAARRLRLWPPSDRDGSGEAGQTAQQAGPEATARPEGIAR